MISSLLPLLLISSFSAQTYFKDNYTQSRQDFTRYNPEWAKEKLNHITAFKVPSEKDPDLTVDALLIGKPTDKNLVVIISGIHGAESFATTAVQHFFLSERAESFAKKNISVLLVHAMNPYGFKYGRRVTENNIDLNRNFYVADENFKSFDEINPSFRALQDYLEPRRPVSSFIASFLHLARGLIGELLFGKLNRQQVNNAVAGGQFEFPQAIFYGGKKLEPQSEWLRDLLRQVFVGREKIVVLDLHTGLGDHGVLHLITGNPEQQLNDILGPQFTTFVKNRSDIRLTTATTPGFYKTNGDLLDYAHRLTLPNQKIVGLTLEYGTLGSRLVEQLRSLNRMILENQGFHHGFESARIQKEVQQSFADLFNPPEESWRAEVMEKADLFFTQLISIFP